MSTPLLWWKEKEGIVVFDGHLRQAASNSEASINPKKG